MKTGVRLPGNHVVVWVLAAWCSVAGADEPVRNLAISAPALTTGQGNTPSSGANSGKRQANALAEAVARLRDSESAVSLTAEGQGLYERDAVKRTAYQYCGAAIGLAERGEFREAVRAASRALFLGVSENNDDYIAHAKRDLAMAYLYAGDIDRAEQYASEALKHVKKAGNRRAVDGVAYKILGDIALKRGDPAKAVAMYDEAIDMADDSQRFFARAAMASACVASGQADKARTAIDKADSYVGVLSPLLQPGARNTMLRIRGALALKEGKADEAVQLYQSALPAETGRADTAYDRFWILEGLGQAQLLKGDKGGALKTFLGAVEASEKIRARFRSEEMKSGLFGEMQEVFGHAIALLMDSGQYEAAWEISEQSRARALLDMMRNRVQLAQGTATYADPYSKPTKVADLVSRLKPGEAVVGYHVLRDRTFAWVIRSAGTKAVAIDVGRRELSREIQAYRDSVVEDRANSSDLGARLYDRLIRPLALVSGEAVTFLPHDSLHYLPFQALKAEGKFLVENVAVSYVPSGGAFVELAGRPVTATGRFFALGNPDLGKPELALPGAEREVAALASMFPGATAYYRKDATRERFAGGISGSRLVHVAAHGSVDALDPLYSKLYLADSSDLKGTLEAKDIYAMKFDGTALVALSACETGLGKVSSGDEVWGFTRSFLSAGAPALLVSLWPVSDESTEVLMKKFYMELSKGSGAARSIQRAQLEVMRDKRFASPFFWGAFNLVGSPR